MSFRGNRAGFLGYRLGRPESSRNLRAVASPESIRDGRAVTVEVAALYLIFAIFISAPNMTANAVGNFANKGPLAGIVGRSSVEKVTVTTSNGTVTIQNNQVTVKCKKAGEDGSCQ